MGGEDMSVQLLDSFTCSICLDPAISAVESVCCNQVYCESCIAALPASNSMCPICRSNDNPVETMPAKAIRRALDSMPAECPNRCGEPLTRGALISHRKKCVFAVTRCAKATCDWRGMAREYPHHIAAEHTEEMLAAAAAFLNPQPAATGSSDSREELSNSNPNLISSDAPQAAEVSAPAPAPATSSASVSAPAAVRYVAAGALDPIVLASGRVSRPGRNGVARYCGGALGFSCSCCNGHCGPTNGCSCVACMQLMVTMYRLPENWLVNREGAFCRLVDGRMVCGCKLNTMFFSETAYCSPREQCNSCAKLDVLRRTAYASISYVD